MTLVDKRYISEISCEHKRFKIKIVQKKSYHVSGHGKSCQD